MVAPSGCSGVQRVPNSGQSVGCSRPCRTRPARHSSGSSTDRWPTSNTLLGVERRVPGRERVAAPRDLPEAPPAPVGDDEDVLDHLQGGRVAVADDRAGVLVLDRRLAPLELRHRGEDALQEVEGLEAGDHDRDAVLRADRLVVAVAGDGADVAGGEEALDLDPVRGEQRLEGGRHQHVRDEGGEVREALRLRPVDGHGVGGGRRLEPDREEDDPAVRVLPGEAQRVEGRVDDPHVPARAPSP